MKERKMNKFDKPTKLDDIDVAFPAAIKHLMPNQEDIPDDFKRFNGNEFVKLSDEWFFEGLDSKKLIAKDGIDKNEALRHLKCIQGSFEPKHEHKSSSVAYLMSLWFDLAKGE